MTFKKGTGAYYSIHTDKHISVFTVYNEIKFIIKASYACSEEVCAENIMFNKPLRTVY